MLRTRILIADDHALVRSGLRALLGEQPDMEVVGEAGDGVVVTEICRRLAPDVLLLDLTMPGRGGIGALEEIRRVCPAVKVLVLTMHEDEPYVRAAFRAGAAGYVLKKSAAEELVTGIRTIVRGRKYVIPTLAHAATQLHPPNPPSARRTDSSDTLTPREREVVALIGLGHTNTEIAGRLHISDRTVETHRMNVAAKLGLQSRADFVRFALDHRLIGN
jgi:two-component system response regulator NreC